MGAYALDYLKYARQYGLLLVLCAIFSHALAPKNLPKVCKQYLDDPPAAGRLLDSASIASARVSTIPSFTFSSR